MLFGQSRWVELGADFGKINGTACLQTVEVDLTLFRQGTLRVEKEHFHMIILLGKHTCHRQRIASIIAGASKDYYLK